MGDRNELMGGIVLCEGGEDGCERRRRYLPLNSARGANL